MGRVAFSGIVDCGGGGGVAFPFTQVKCYFILFAVNFPQAIRIHLLEKMADVE